MNSKQVGCHAHLHFASQVFVVGSHQGQATGLYAWPWLVHVFVNDLDEI